EPGHARALHRRGPCPAPRPQPACRGRPRHRRAARQPAVPGPRARGSRHPRSAGGVAAGTGMDRFAAGPPRRGQVARGGARRRAPRAARAPGPEPRERPAHLAARREHRRARTLERRGGRGRRACSRRRGADRRGRAPPARDLGMCKDLARSSGLTVAAGTSGFRPPEQERHGRVDARADIWAMSALLSWLAKGSRRPAALTRALSRGMAENPRRRPADVEAWLASIEEALAEPPADPPAEASAPAAHAETAEAGAAPARPRRRARMALAAVLLVVGLAAGLGLGERVWHDPPVAAADGVSVAIDGPEEVSVGETATFTADVTGAETW